MANKSYDEVSVTRALFKNRGVNIEGNRISVDNSSGLVGNGTWGKIDYLCKVRGYVLIKNEQHDKGNRKNYAAKVRKPNKEDKTIITGSIHPAKINMVNMTKMAMKNSLN